MKTINKVLIGIGVVALISMLGFYIFLEVCLYPAAGPLMFSIHNRDASEHDVKVEIFDSNNITIFNKNYSIGPRYRESGHIQSPEITKKRGKYTFKVTLDNNVTKMHRTSVSKGHLGISITIMHSDIHMSDIVV